MSGLDSLYSTVSSLGEKISALNITNTIQAGVSDLSQALQNNFKTPALSIISKFEANDLPKFLSAKDSVSPEESNEQKQKYIGALAFPNGMKYYTKFTFYAYDRKVVNVPAQESPSVTIILPMPNNLQEAFNITYQTPALGPIAGAASKTVMDALRSGSVSDITKAAGDMSTYTTAGVVGGLGVLKNMGSAGETAAAIGTQALGVAPNPNIAVIFSDVGLRSHTFSYKLAAANLTELQQIKDIVKNLKKSMLPGLANEGSMLFTFPDVCDIEFGPDATKPYTIKRSVMENFTVNYSPMSSPAFFKTGDPVMVEINMSFKEMSPFTRSDLQSPSERSRQTAQSAVADADHDFTPHNDAII